MVRYVSRKENHLHPATLSVTSQHSGIATQIALSTHPGPSKFSLRFTHIISAEIRIELEHRIGIGLAELELAQSAIRRLTYYKVLADRVRVAEAALQRIGIE